jgi:hypothetical protein
MTSHIPHHVVVRHRVLPLSSTHPRRVCKRLQSEQWVWVCHGECLALVLRALMRCLQAGANRCQHTHMNCLTRTCGCTCNNTLLPASFQAREASHSPNLPAMLNQPLMLGARGSSSRRAQSRIDRLLHGVSLSLQALRTRGSKISLLRKLFTLCAQDKPKVYLSVLFLFLEIGSYIALQFFCEQQMDISAALNQPLFSCNNGNPFAVPSLIDFSTSDSKLTCNTGQCTFSNLMNSDVTTVCDFCDGACTSCVDPRDRQCSPTHSTSAVYQKLDQCQRKFRTVSKYSNSLGLNCSASVYQLRSYDKGVFACTDRSDPNCDTCYYTGPTYVVQCSYGSSTNQTSSPNTSALTGQIVINFYYMLALGFGEVVFNALYAPPSLAHLICLGRSAPHVVTICLAATRGFCELLAPI